MEYDASYYVEPNIISYSEYVYNDTLNPPSTRSSLEASRESEYVYDDDGEYVLHYPDMRNHSKELESNGLEYKRPGHKKSEDNVYDELDYDISPRVTKSGELKDAQNNQKVEKDALKRGLSLRMKTIIILSFVGVSVIVAIIAAVLFSHPGTS